LSSSARMGLRMRPEDKSNEPNIRFQRLNHWREAQIDEGDQHAWAVSYSDLLMVLLSFFVLFFSFSDDKETTGLISEIAVAIKGGKTEHGGKSSGEKVLENTSASQTPSSRFTKKMAAKSIASKKMISSGLDPQLLMALAALPPTMKTENTPDSLIISLADDLFASGKYKLSRSIQKEMDTLVAAIKPFEEKIEVYFIGHTDSVPTSHRTKFITSNYVLSALRAAEALEYAKNMGLSADRLFVQASADKILSSRTLSMRIRAKTGAKGAE
jgi:flagellar motor protein MotB